MIRPRLPIALLALLVVPACGSGDRGPRPNILLLSLDTTRRDHLGCYGYTRPTSPHLDRLAADSVVYTNGYAVSSWTMPTHASMFTGKMPSAHGATYDPDGPLKLSDGIGNFDQYRARPIAENETTLAMILSEAGYATGGVIAGPWMKKVFRLGKGFEHYDDDGVTALNGRPAEDVTRAAIEFVDAHADEPFFLFLNYYDPHSPWVDEHGAPFSDLRPVVTPDLTQAKMAAMSKAEQARLLYDAEIRRMDAAIGVLLDHLRAKGLYEDTWIFVVSDHGELIGETIYDGNELWGHGDSLSQAEIHIPFFVKGFGAGARTGTDPRPSQQTDILPTICDGLELPLPPNVQGRSLRTRPNLTVAELVKLPVMDRMGSKAWPHQGNWNAIIDGNDKVLWSANATHVLIDLASDPDERHNRFEEREARGQELLDLLQRYLAGLPAPGATGEVEQAGSAELEMLKGLGYVGDDGPKPVGSKPVPAPVEDEEKDEPGATPPGE